MGVFEISKRYGLTAEQRGQVRDRVGSILEGMTKEAVSDAGRAFMYTLGGSTAGAAVAYGVPAAVSAVRNSRIRANREKLIGEMAKAHPEIRNYSKRDVELVFNSLALHAPRMLEDPLLGGQVMLDALQRGNRMDVSTLSNVSKLTGGSGLQGHESDAATMLAKGTQEGTSRYIEKRYMQRDAKKSGGKKKKP